jgi:DNA-binding CsgD family transcriptional regulator
MAGASRLTERDCEIAELEHAIDEVASGSGRFVLVEGPAGIGKSSLLAIAKHLGGAVGACVLAARGSEFEREFGFGVVRQLFEPLIAALSDKEKGALFGGAAAQAAVVVDPTVSTSSPTGDLAVLHGLYWLIVNLCEMRPVVLIVDDFHWVDADSLKFLAHLQPRVEGLRLLIVGAARPNEPGAARVVDAITADPSCAVLRPAALSRAGTAKVLKQELSGNSDPMFVESCHTATGGNPLLLRELMRSVISDGISRTADDTGLIADLASETLGSSIQRRLSQLGTECVELARAVALMGDDVSISMATALTTLNAYSAAAAARRLCDVQILEKGDPLLQVSESVGVDAGQLVLRFVHPLVRAAVYDRMSPYERVEAHGAAARLLTASDADSERIAAHILRIPPSGDPEIVASLRRAATAALRRASLTAAVTYLERCLQEPPPKDQLLEIVEQLGVTAVAVDPRIAAKHLTEALALAEEPIRRVRIAISLGQALLFAGNIDASVEVERKAITEVSAENEDLARSLHAGLLNTGLLMPNRADLVSNVEYLRRLPFHDSAGGRVLAAILANYCTTIGDPDALKFASQALSGATPAEGGTIVVCYTLAGADDPGVISHMDLAISWAHQRGSIRDGLIGALWRGISRLTRGDLEGAEADAVRCKHEIDTSASTLGRPFLGPCLADIYLEQGRIEEANTALSWVGVDGVLSQEIPSLQFVLDTQSRLLRAQRRYDEALKAAMSAGDRFAAQQGRNPAIVPWRSEAALCLHALGRVEEARGYADEEVTLARIWGAPRALGRALRVVGMLQSRDEGLPALEEAVHILKHSPARLEYAKALVELGSVRRRLNQRQAAREPLREGWDLATILGARPLAERARTELAAAGARPRHSALTGVESLTPSELRIAELATNQQTNREIATALFVTPKTVEVHLGNVYRKLGITKRRQLSDALGMTNEQ